MDLLFLSDSFPVKRPMQNQDPDPLIINSINDATYQFFLIDLIAYSVLKKSDKRFM